MKKAARALLARLKQLLVLNGWPKATARLQLKLTIEDTPDSGPPRAYTYGRYNRKCLAALQHVYERHLEEWNAGIPLVFR